MRIHNEFLRNADFNINCETSFYFDVFPLFPFRMLLQSFPPLPLTRHFFNASLFLTNWKNVSRRALSLFPGSCFMDTFFSERTYPTVLGIDGPFSRVCPSLYLFSYAKFRILALATLSRGAAEMLTKFFLRCNMKHPYD